MLVPRHGKAFARFLQGEKVGSLACFLVLAYTYY